MNRKVNVWLSFLVVVALALSACAQTKPEPTEAPAEEPMEEPAEDPAEEPAEQPPAESGLSGRILWWGLAEYNFEDTWEDVIAAYNEKEPDVQVDVEIFPEEAWLERIATAVAAGGDEAPDVFVRFGIPQNQMLDACLPLDDLIERDGIDTSVFDPQAWELSKIEGGTYGLPRSIHGGEGYFYNKDLFDQFGVAYPEEDWTWTDAIAIAQQLTDKENRYYGMAVGSWVDYSSLGFDVMATDRSAILGYMDSQEAVDGMRVIKTLYDCCSPTFEQQDTQFQDVTGGGVGPIGAFIAGRAAIASIDMGVHQQLTNAGINWGYAPIPLVDQPDRRYNPGRGYVLWSVNRNSSNVEAAWDFMKWMATSDEGATLMASAGYPVPYAGPMERGGYPEAIVDVYFAAPDPSWKPMIIWPWDHPCGWDGVIGPFMTASEEIFNSPPEMLEEILDRGAVDAQAAWDACVELTEAGE